MEIKVKLDAIGRPCLDFIQPDKTRNLEEQVLEEQVLEEFISHAKERGIEIKEVDVVGGRTRYQIQLKNNL